MGRNNNNKCLSGKLLDIMKEKKASQCGHHRMNVWETGVHKMNSGSHFLFLLSSGSRKIGWPYCTENWKLNVIITMEREKDAWHLGAGFVLPVVPWCCYELRWHSVRSWCPLSEHTHTHTQNSHNINIKLEHFVTIVNQDKNMTSLLSCVNTDKMTKHPPPQLIWVTAVSFPVTAFIVPFSRLKY